jgi:hypothetical protein
MFEDPQMTCLNSFINIISTFTGLHITIEIDLLLHNLPGVMISGKVGSRWHTIKMSFATACSIRHLLGAFICTHDVWQLGCLLEIGGSN